MESLNWTDGFEVFPGFTLIPEGASHAVSADLILTVSTGQSVKCHIETTLPQEAVHMLDLGNLARVINIQLRMHTQQKVVVTKVLYTNPTLWGVDGCETTITSRHSSQAPVNDGKDNPDRQHHGRRVIRR